MPRPKLDENFDFPEEDPPVASPEDGVSLLEEEKPQPLEPEPPQGLVEQPKKGKRKVKRNVKDILEDDGTFTFEDAANPDDSLEDHFRKLDGFFKNLSAAHTMENWKIHLHRLEPKEIEGIKADGFLEPVSWPVTAPQLYEMVAKKHGGGKYKVMFWDNEGNIRGQIYLDIPGVSKLQVERPKDGQPDPSVMTARERELMAMVQAKEREEDKARVRAEYEAKNAKDKQQSSSELMQLFRTMMISKSGTDTSTEIKEIIRRQEDLIQDLRAKLDFKNNENSMAQVLKAMVEMNRPRETQTNNPAMLEWVKILLPVVMDKLKPKDITENPMFSTLLTKIFEQKAVPAEEMMRKVVDMNLDFTKKVAEMRIEKLMDDDEGGGDDGNITPKDILTTVSGAFETMMNRFGAPGQPGQPQQGAPRQPGAGQTSPPKLVTPGEEEEEEEGDEEPEEEQKKVQIMKLNDQTRELLKGSIKSGNSGANFGKLLIQQIPALADFKEVIKSTDVPGLVKIVEPFLSEAVGDEVKGLLFKTENGKRYMKEAIEYVKANI